MYNMENVIEKGGSPMLLLEKMAHRRITSANYITSVNGMVHPDRILAEHDFLYMLDGEWEIIEDGHIYEMHRDDLLILSAGRHHRAKNSVTPETGTCIFTYFPRLLKQAKKMTWKKWNHPSFFHAIPCCTAGTIRISACILRNSYLSSGQTARKSSAASPCFSTCFCVKSQNCIQFPGQAAL